MSSPSHQQHVVPTDIQEEERREVCKRTDVNYFKRMLRSSTFIECVPVSVVNLDHSIGRLKH